MEDKKAWNRTILVILGLVFLGKRKKMEGLKLAYMLLNFLN